MTREHLIIIVIDHSVSKRPVPRMHHHFDSWPDYMISLMRLPLLTSDAQLAPRLGRSEIIGVEGWNINLILL